MSVYQYDATGYVENDFEPIPEGKYSLVIRDVKEKESTTERPLFNVEFSVDDKEYLGRKLWNNYTLIPKGEPGWGILVHFLKTINEPWEGQIEINPESWIGKILDAYIYIENDSVGKKRNKIGKIWPKETYASEKSSENVPF